MNIDNVSDFWINDPTILFHGDNWYKIIPNDKMDINEILNSLTRIIIYLAIIYLIFSSDKQGIYLLIIILLIIIIIYFVINCKKNKCYKISNNNSNNSPSNLKHYRTYNFNSNAKSKGITENDSLEEPHIKLLNRQFYKDSEKMHEEKIHESENEFENQKNQNNQENQESKKYQGYQDKKKEFANWLYQPSRNCKENMSDCLRYEDIRYTRK